MSVKRFCDLCDEPALTNSIELRTASHMASGIHGRFILRTDKPSDSSDLCAGCRVTLLTELLDIAKIELHRRNNP
jgi:hypothetical protein